MMTKKTLRRLSCWVYQSEGRFPHLTPTQSLAVNCGRIVVLRNTGEMVEFKGLQAGLTLFEKLA